MGKNWLYLLLPFLPLVAAATVLRVPGNYPTIQAALSSCLAHDTILVAVGTYAEELTAPALPFVLKGQVRDSSGAPGRPVIDPSPLSNPQTRHCLYIPDGAEPVIEDFNFRNGAAMYPRQEIDYGGVIMDARTFALRRCRFDSTSGGLIASYDSMIAGLLEYCDFIHVQQTGCLYGRHITATDCIFSSSGSATVYVHCPSTFERCTFRDNSHCELLIAGGEGLVLRNCTIGPCSTAFAAVHTAGGLIENCRFRAHVQPPVANYPNVRFQVMDAAAQLTLRNNVWQSNDVRKILRLGDTWGQLYNQEMVLVEDNVFVHNDVVGDWGKVIETSVGMRLVRNRFRDNGPQFPIVGVTEEALGPVTLRDNFFPADEWALTNARTEVVDAAFNWWGDSTGPACAENPNGQGGEVMGNVIVSPWHTDTLFLTDAEEELPLPREFTFTAFPNPFNSTVQIRFELPQASRVKLTVYDVLGRVVETLADQVYVAGEHEVEFKAGNVAAGVYFVRLQSGAGTAMRKIVLLK